METSNFKSVIDLIRYFNTEDKCVKYLEQIRWGEDGVSCPFCGSSRPYIFKGTHTYKCSNNCCNQKFNVKTQSVFENTKLPLVKWIAAFYLFSSHKKGISSVQIAKDLGVTQKTGWFLLHRIRETYSKEMPDLLTGTIEIDETFVGGKNKNRHWDKKVEKCQGRSYKDKTPVLGILCRETRQVYNFVIPSTKKKDIQPILYDHIAPNTDVYTDEWKAYRGINWTFNHNYIRHNIKQFAEGDVNTNSIEGHWSHFKRGVIGIYHKTTRKHLQRYADEFAFRYNTKDESETGRMVISITNAYEKRLTYNQLIAA